MGGRYGPKKPASYDKPAGRHGRGSTASGGITAIRRAYKHAVDEELTKLQDGPVRQFTPEEIAKLNAELRRKK